jgi:quercetin dioxygenase-like cupin family protein
MNRTEFESECHAQGYHEIVDRRMDANTTNPEHSHEFDARLLVLEGDLTIAREGGEQLYRAGDTLEMTAGCQHTERSGPAGARYLAGRRFRQAAAS